MLEVIREYNLPTSMYRHYFEQLLQIVNQSDPCIIDIISSWYKALHQQPILWCRKRFSWLIFHLLQPLPSRSSQLHNGRWKGFLLFSRILPWKISILWHFIPDGQCTLTKLLWWNSNLHRKSNLTATVLLKGNRKKKKKKHFHYIVKS